MSPLQVASAPNNDPHKESFSRRQHLNEEMGVAEDGSVLSPISVSSFFAIERYYDAANKVLGSFEEAYKDNDLDSCYVFGKRYCSFVIHSLPQHNYFTSPKYSKLRKEHTKNVEVVIKFLEKVISEMDKEEKAKRIERERQAEIERKRVEELKKEQEEKAYQELLKRAEQTRQTGQKTGKTKPGENVQESALSKLRLLSAKSSDDSSKPAEKPKQSSGQYATSGTEDEGGNISATENTPPSYGSLPPPLPPPEDGKSEWKSSNGSLPTPMAPPSYDFANNSNRHNPFLGPKGKNGVKEPYALPPPVQPWSTAGPPGYGTVVGSSTLPDPPNRHHYQLSQQQQPKPKKQRKVPVRQLREQAQRRYLQLQNDGRIEIRVVNTYQGKYNQSINGCTVISPLVVARHLRASSGVMLTENEIKDIIDNECGPLLREIRGRLGLDNHSLIIPSDVHDHLVDKKILNQKHFVGATGGNIISDEHIGEVLKLFAERDKAGAVLFFREHVISIIKTPVGNGRTYYDFVDSMPGFKDSRNQPCASRTRCKDIEALADLLKWYATKKFSDANCAYIDRNDWNDNMADFDPRVFQAFVWGIPPTN